MRNLVLCPGSRSAPLAIAAGRLASYEKFSLKTCIDERSAGFFALGLSTATGKATVVITTSGSAVAHLLPSGVEADRSCQPLLFITADRPKRLKNCGANQTVNQEEFLLSVCRSYKHGPTEGIHLLNQANLSLLVENTWKEAHSFPGPVHLNLPIEEPLYPNELEQEEVFSGWIPESFESVSKTIRNVYIDQKNSIDIPKEFSRIDPSLPGVMVVGPWRGNNRNLNLFKQALNKWHSISGWPLIADPLSGLQGDQPGLIKHWDLLLPNGLKTPDSGIQVMRLGPMPVSRKLETWLSKLGGLQFLISEGDSRKLDPLGISIQWSGGFCSWLETSTNISKFKSCKSKIFEEWARNDKVAQNWLDEKLPFQGYITEPALARWLPRLLPEGLSLMLSASSPIRDWVSFSEIRSSSDRCFGFRGASGIDGTLSLAMGLSNALGQTILVTGDLALLHDTNGWLLSNSSNTKLVVFLIDNGGGGIFHQLGINKIHKEDIDTFFAMPQQVDPFLLVSAYGIPYKQVTCFEDLELALEWALSLPRTSLIRVCTDPKRDMVLRKEISEGVNKRIDLLS